MTYRERDRRADRMMASWIATAANAAGLWAVLIRAWYVMWAAVAFTVLCWLVAWTIGRGIR